MVPFKIPFQNSIPRVLALALLALGCSTTLSAQTLAWNANTESNLAGYRVQYGTVSGSPSATVDVGRVTSKTFTGLTPGATYYFRVVAYNTSGQTSAPSAQVSYRIPAATTTPAPTLTSVSPASGPTSGGTTITLTGTNFVSGATVRVGGVAATNVAFASSTRLTARTPAGTAGARDVVVTNPNGQVAVRIGAFTYTAATSSGTLTATAVSPLSGPTSGGTVITVTGTGFVSGATIAIGGTAATGVTYVSSTQLRATTPAKAAGGYSVIVRNPNGQTANTPRGFTYSGTSTPPPSGSTLTATAVSPNSGPTSGGTAITITGTGFVSGAAVLIGGTPATSVSVASSTRITARTPAKPAGGYPVQVRNPNGQIVNTPRGFLYGATTSVQTAAATLAMSTLDATDLAAAPGDAANTEGVPDGAADAALDSAVADLSNTDALDAAQPQSVVTRYLAEGVESAQMHTRLAIANPEDGAAHVRLTFMNAEGAVTQQNVDVPARSRRTLDLGNVPQLAGTSFSTMLESDRVVAVDRRVSLDAAGAATVTAAVDEASPTWFFAEAPTAAPFEQFYLVQNPSAADTQVDVRYLLPGNAEPIVRTHTVAAHSRATIWVDREAAALASTTVGAEIASVDGTPIVVERTVYTTQDGSAQPRSGVTQAGVTSIDGPSDDSSRGGARWLIADAQPGASRQASSVVIANEGATTDVKVTLLFEDGAPAAPATFKVAAGTRFSVPLAQAFPAAAGRSFSVLVEAADPVATLTVERTIPRQTADRTAAATGAAAAGTAAAPSTPATRLP